MNPLADLKAFIDSHVIISVPRKNRKDSKLYSIHRKTNHSAIEVEVMDNLQFYNTPNSVRRQNFHGTIIRAGCGLLYLGFFNRSDDLPAPVVITDHWAIMSFELLKVVESTLGFRMLIKCFDDYGWPINGQFTGLVGFMQRHHAEISATGVVLHNERMNVLDYVDGLFEFKLGLLFRQPNLASVTNIFVLPFSDKVWLCLVGLLVITCTSIWCQLRVNQWLHAHKNRFQMGDILSFISGVVCQQGYSLGVETFAVRTSILVILVASIFLFTSYTASIVALLQSPAFLINSLEDFSESALRIGIEDLPYEKKFLQEDDHDVIKDIYEHKVIPEKERGFLNTTEGIRLVRAGMYAFQCELANAFKLIGETYTASEKCGLKKLDLFPNRMLGPTTTKGSPFKEILAVKLRWMREVGITQRTISRWSYTQPSCSSTMGFSSVGVSDVRPLLIFILCGILTAFVLMLLEKYVYYAACFRKKVLGPSREAGVKQAWVAKNREFYH